MSHGQDVLEVIMSRRSIRKFKSKEVPDEVIEKLLLAATSAPTAGGIDWYIFIVVKSLERRKRVYELLKEAHKFYAAKALKTPWPSDKIKKFLKRLDEGLYLAPLYIAIYMDLTRELLAHEFKDIERIWAIQSLAAAVENILIAAHSLGLGAVWLGVPLFMKDEFNEVLEPPPNTELTAIVALGYPDETPIKRRPRKPLSEIVIYR